MVGGGHVKHLMPEQPENNDEQQWKQQKRKYVTQHVLFV